MRLEKLVAYYRVSTAQQEASGLDLDAQRQALTAFLAGSAVVAKFTETESGKHADRPSWHTRSRMPAVQRQAGDREARPPVQGRPFPAGT
ncbi:recombinase family protein [Methylobacterium sp. WL64]|uniref:recombinase family protein n=1 Tax=Methylobacterium sp. WL64 TaxID=2603894 RepID=UPI0027B87F2F|nr:recombinase family protein [Methylobacterium sp. WL64]